MSQGNGHINWESSYINQEWIEKARIYRVDHIEGAELIGRDPNKSNQRCDGIALPYYAPGAERPHVWRLRRDYPDYKIQADGSRKEEGKYLGAAGWGTAAAYFPPETPREWLDDSAIPAVIVEGEKKAIALRRYYFERDERCLVIALPGVWNFRAKAKIREDGFFIGTASYVIPDIASVNWQNRRAKILFDANALSNPSVNAARWQLGRELVARGADVRIVDLEPESGINGADDYLGKHGVKKFAEYLATHQGQPVWMELDTAKEVVKHLPDWIKGDTSKAATLTMLNALQVVKEQSPVEWVSGPQAVLKKAGSLRYINEQLKLNKDMGQRPKPKLTVVRDGDTTNDAPLPVIDFGFEPELKTITRAAWSALKAANRGPHLFIRSGIPIRLEKDESGRPVMAELTADRMRYELARAALWQKKGEDDIPPMEYVKDVLAMPEPPLPVLRRIVNVPVFAPDGRLIDREGYDQESGIYYLPSPDFEAIPIPDEIGIAEVNEANRLLCDELLVDFPFASVADRDNAVALCVLGAVREMIHGSTPNHAVEASLRSAGKGKLARAAAGIFAGDELASVPPLETEKEWKDMITSELLSGAPAVLIDNIEKPLRSAALAVAWTEPFWKDRLFHKQVMARIPINCVWITTANNMLMHEDLMTRSIRIRLEPDTPHPENRTGLKDLDEWCRENRPNLVWAVHILVKWWLQQGRPAPVGLQSTRHANWCRVMGGILYSAGYTEFLKNQGDFQRTAAQGADAAGAFCLLWWYWAHEPEISPAESLRRMTKANTTELVRQAKGVDGFPLSDNEKGESNSLGLWLNNVRNRQIEAREETEIEGEYKSRTFKIYRHPVQVRGKIPWRLEELE